MTDLAMDLRPEAVFRVGVTGHRELEADALEGLRAAVRQCLEHVVDALEPLAASPEGAALYRRDKDGPAFRLKAVSPLASGADRLFAKEALDVGAELFAPLPFAADDYEKDSPDSAQAFREYLALARVFTLDGVRDKGARQTESYRAVGRFVVRNSDLVIALWDGERERGQGGTGEIVRFAVRAGVPVWWIDAHGRRPARLLLKTADFAAPEATPSGPEAMDALRRLLRAEILAPPWTPAPCENLFDVLADLARRLTSEVKPPLEDFYRGQALAAGGVWRLHAALTSVFGPRRRDAAPQLAAAESRIEHYWRPRFEAADRISSACAERYRSSYVLIAVLAFFALSAATMAFDWPRPRGNEAITSIELAAIFGIAILVVANRAFQWHERWISSRLLAEVCRAQYTLSGLGGALPGRAVARLAFDVDKDKCAPHETWVAFAYMALLRGAPFPEGDMTAAKLRALQVGRSLIAEQAAYHEARFEMSENAGRWLARGAEAFFALTFTFAAVKLGFLFAHENEPAQYFQVIGAIVSAATGAIVGVRAYAEFSLLSRQSNFMMRVLAAASEELEAAALILDAPLSSAALSRALGEATTAMLQDITGWAHLFRIKSIEAG